MATSNQAVAAQAGTTAPKQPSMGMNVGFLASPQASDYLPSISPTVVYSTAQAAWTPQELQVLQTGLAQFPADQFDNVTRYIKIAALLPKKCVRDVAFKVKALGAAGPPAGQAAAKRMKIEPYQEPTGQQAASGELEEARLAALLQDNVLAINTMRTNLLNGKADENRAQMSKFRDNCQTVLSALGDICTSIPPLPLQIDTSLIELPRKSISSSASSSST